MSHNALRHQRREPTRATVRQTINARELTRDAGQYGARFGVKR